MENLSFSMIILAGGKSSRMGQDKADLLLHGKSFLEIQIEKARELGISDIVVSGYRGQLQQSDVRIIPDEKPEQGPLGGLSTCLNVIKSQWALVLSVDAPLVPASELRHLLKYAEEEAQKAVIVQSGAQQYPLIGVYHRSLVPAMLEEVTQRKGSVFAMLRRAGYAVYMSEADESVFSNVNDPASYQRMLRDE